MSTPMPNGCEILNNPDATFDDVKHILYSGVKYVVFDLDGYEEDSSLYKLYKYSKERFPDKVFDNIIEVAEIAENKEKADTKVSAIPFSEFKLNSDGLIPCIAQDYRTGEVLMMAYMNEDSYNKTLQTGLMTYWTRSRQRLWTKGEESGHFQKVISLTIDCDKDTILAKVDQTGPACHTGNPTCFFTPLTESAEATDADKKDIYK